MPDTAHEATPLKVITDLSSCEGWQEAFKEHLSDLVRWSSTINAAEHTFEEATREHPTPESTRSGGQTHEAPSTGLHPAESKEGPWKFDEVDSSAEQDFEWLLRDRRLRAIREPPNLMKEPAWDIAPAGRTMPPLTTETCEGIRSYSKEIAHGTSKRYFTCSSEKVLDESPEARYPRYTRNIVAMRETSSTKVVIKEGERPLVIEWISVIYDLPDAGYFSWTADRIKAGHRTFTLMSANSTGSNCTFTFGLDGKKVNPPKGSLPALQAPWQIPGTANDTPDSQSLATAAGFACTIL